MVSETLLQPPERAVCYLYAETKKGYVHLHSTQPPQEKNVFQNGVRSRKSLRRKVAGDWPHPTLQVAQQPLVMTPADHSPCEKAVVALMRLPETMVWCKCGTRS